MYTFYSTEICKAAQFSDDVMLGNPDLKHTSPAKPMLYALPDNDTSRSLLCL